MGFIESLFGSELERIYVRPSIPLIDDMLNKLLYIRKSSLDLKVDWTLERSKIFSRIVRLVDENKNTFIGWGLDENFIISELLPLYSAPSGCVELPKLHDSSSKIRFAHISDLHICWHKNKTMEGDYFNEKVLKEISKSLDEQNIDFLVVTGDITDNGLGYMKFYRAFEKYIKAGKLITIPGNHDVNSLGFFPVNSAFKFDDYSEFSRIVMGPCCNSNYVLDGGSYLIAGIDSSGSKNRSNILNNAIGKVNEQFMEQISRKMDVFEKDGKERYKILLLHHRLELPPETGIEIGKMTPGVSRFHKLANADLVLDFCRKYKINLILHGHEHLSYCTESKNVEGMKIISAPQITNARAYSVLELSNNKLKRNIVNF